MCTTISSLSSSDKKEAIHGRHSSMRLTGMQHMDCHTRRACSSALKCSMSRGRTCSSSLARCCPKVVCSASVQQMRRFSNSARVVPLSFRADVNSWYMLSNRSPSTLCSNEYVFATFFTLRSSAGRMT